ncbi:hypothetical protein BGW36DRAFT_268823, partial [Talaromyces proteolyticus]
KPSAEEIDMQKIEAENNLISTWAQSQSVLDCQHRDGEANTEESGPVEAVGPLILI